MGINARNSIHLQHPFYLLLCDNKLGWNEFVSSASISIFEIDGISFLNLDVELTSSLASLLKISSLPKPVYKFISAKTIRLHFPY